MKYISGIIILIFILLVIAQADKKYVLDELDFPIVAKATSETGIPIYYRGEGSENTIGIYHPTLYINSLALYIKIFGYKENIVRSFGMICTILTAFLSILIYNQIIIDKTRQNTFAILFFSCFLFNPYTLANATLPDIDSTVLPITINLFLFATLRLFKNHQTEDNIDIHKKVIFLLSLIFALNLWAKLTTPIVLPFFGVMLLYLLGHKFTKSISIMGLIFIFGLIVFFVTYWMYCYFLHLPFAYTFKFLFQSFTKGTTGSLTIFEKIYLNFSYSPLLLNWLTIPLISLFVIAFNIALFRKNELEVRLSILIGSIGIFVMLFYLCLISPFGGFFKYPFATISLIFIFIVHIITDFININKKQLNLFLICTLFISILCGYSDLTYLNLTKENHIYTLLFLVIAIVLSFILSAFGLKGNEARKYFKYAVIILFSVTIGNELTISRAQAISSYPTKYHFGQTGFDEAVVYLRNVTKNDEIIWAMKDIGYYVNNRYIENYSYLFSDKGLILLEKLMQKGQVRYYVVTTKIGQDRIDAYPKVKAVLDKYANIDKSFGNIVIYRIIE